MTFRLLVLLLVCAAPASAQERSLLLGWRAEAESPSASDRASPYRSLLVYPEPDGRYHGQAGTGLLVARPSGVLRVGVENSTYDAWQETFVWAAPAGTLPQYTGIDAFNGEYCRGYRRQTLRFVSAAFLAVETRSAGFCEGTASPWDFRTFSVLRPDSLGGDGLDVQQVLGEDALEAFFESAEAFLDALPESRQVQYIPEPDPANWSLVHRRGAWKLVGRLESAELTRSANVVDFDVDFDVSPRLVGAQKTIPWTRVVAAARDARDVFVSPSGALVAIQRPLLLTVHPVVRGRIQAAVLGHPLPQGASIVSVQWLDGAATQRVRAALRGEGGR